MNYRTFFLCWPILVTWPTITSTISGIRSILKVARNASHENGTTKQPWGYEKVQVITELYLLKELYIREGFQSSYHYHKKKDETMLITRARDLSSLRISENTSKLEYYPHYAL